MSDFESSFRGNPNLKRPGTQIEWSPEMIQEYVKCQEDPIYFAETYVKIVTEDGLVPIVLRDYQKEMILSMKNNRNTFSLQSRQSGKTETIRCFTIWYILFNSHKTVAILADKEATVKEILYKIQIAYMALPKWLQHGVSLFNKQSFILENGSRIIVAGTSSNSIRGLTIHCLILDEFCHISNFDEFYASVYPTISAGKHTKLCFASTPLGLNHGWKFWKDSEEGRNDFYRIYVPWQRVPGRDEAWKQKTLASLGGDLEKFSQEFEIQFIGSSGTLIAGWKLKNLVHRTPISEKDNLKQYSAPVKDHNYVMLCDVSDGKGLDYSTIQVIDTTKMPYEQVCTFHSNMVAPADFAAIIFRLGKSYNSAPVLIEINNMGEQVSYILQNELEYEHILKTQSMGRAGKQITYRGGKGIDNGIRTTVSTKAAGCSLLKLILESDQLIINDYDTIYELSRFSRKGRSYEAETGNHDDLVMPLVHFSWLTDQKLYKELTNISTLSALRDTTNEELDSTFNILGYTMTGDIDIDPIITNEPDRVDELFGAMSKFNSIRDSWDD